MAHRRSGIGSTRRPSTRATPRPASPAKPAYEVREFQNWDAFKNLLRGTIASFYRHDENGFYTHKKYVYRGQGNAAWPLRSTFDRAYSDKQAGGRDALAKTLVREFYEECARYSPWAYDVDDPRVLAMAQHHGLPTRLLDWSFSPYVAAYFAFAWFLFDPFRVRSAGEDEVAIWVLNREEVQTKAPEGQLQIVTVQDHDNTRLGNQAGLFTYLKTNEGNLEDYLTSPAVNLAGTLLKLKLPSQEAPAALRDLIMMGIHHATIFPGREGIAQTIKLRKLLDERLD